MIRGMLGRKVGMMRLYDGAGRAHGVTAIQLGRPGHAAPHRGARRLHRGPDRLPRQPQAGQPAQPRPPGHGGPGGRDPHAAARVPRRQPRRPRARRGPHRRSIRGGLLRQRERHLQGRGFAGGVKRWGFHGGPKTHGQSDRHRAPGSVGAGTTPGKVFKGQKMAGHMGARTVSVLNLLVVATDPSRDLLFVAGSVPGPPNGLVQVTPGRKAALADYEPPEIPSTMDDEAPNATEATGTLSPSQPSRMTPRQRKSRTSSHATRGARRAGRRPRPYRGR